MRRSLLVLLAACSHAGSGAQGREATAAAPEPAPSAPAAAGPSAPVPVSSTPGSATPSVVRKGGRTAMIEAPHGGAIATLALTPDGTAAVSVDELGGVRLWPVLDGSVEPRIVDLPTPRSLVLVPEKRGFLIAMLDEVGSLVLEVVDRDGLSVQRASPPSDPAFQGVEVSPSGPIAWRADQIVMRFAPDGSVLEQLPTEPGQRIVTIAASGERAVAVIESGTSKLTRRARWLSLAPKLAWGGWIDAGDDVGRVLALSPSGARLGMLTGAVNSGVVTVTVIDTKTGKLISTQNDQAAVGIGFVDDDHLAIASNGTITWAKVQAPAAALKPTVPRPDQPNNLLDSGLLAVGGGRAVAGFNGELMIATPTKIEYLGYGLQSPAVAAAAPGGQLMIGLGDAFALLDKDLKLAASPSLGVSSTSAVAELKWLGGTDWLVESSRISDGITSLALVDTATGKSQVLRSDLAMVQLLLHEPATQLVTLSLGDAPEVSKYDPVKHRLDKVAALPKPKGYEQAELVPVVPALAGGTQLVVVHMRDRMTLRWVTDPKALDKGTSITVDGSLAGVDAAGRAYVWQNTPTGPLELAIYEAGKRTGSLPTDGPVTLWPDKKGTRVVQVGQRSVGLLATTGKRLWLSSLQFVTEALWLDDATLVVISAGGLARIDAATGKVMAARCGWRFGLSAKQHPPTSRVEPVCAQLR